MQSVGQTGPPNPPLMDISTELPTSTGRCRILWAFRLSAAASLATSAYSPKAHLLQQRRLLAYEFGSD